MFNLRSLCLPLAVLLAICLFGCSGAPGGDQPIEPSNELVKPALTGHYTSEVGTNSDECTILTDQHGPVGNCLISNDGEMLVADWQIDPGWVIESIRIYAGAQPPPATIEYIRSTPVLPDSQVYTPQFGIIETGPVTPISLSNNETQLPPTISVSPVNVPISNLCQLPYRNDNLQVRDGLKLNFSLENCDPGASLYILSELTVTNGIAVAEARVVDLDGNQLIEQFFKPHVDLPSEEITTFACNGSYFPSLGLAPKFFITFPNCPDGLDITSNQQYPGWCVQLDRYMKYDEMQITLYNTLDPELPEHLRSNHWDMINYCINHRHDYPIDGNGLQEAIWYFSNGRYASFNAKKLVEDALENGEGYTPGSGDLLAVIVDRPEETQDSIIAVVVGETENPTE